jgi:Flp pilus assembly protein TadD
VRLELWGGNLCRARDIAEEALQGWRHVSELVYQRAEVERRAGRFGEAHELYIAARLLHPWTDLYLGDPRSRGVGALIGLAKTAAMQGDLGLARDALREALELEPGDVEARTLRARLLAVAGDESGAWAELSALLADAPGSPPVLLLAAELAWAKGEAATAQGFWQGAAKFPASRAQAQAWLAISKLVAGQRGGIETDFATSDLPETAARLVLAVLGLGSFELDPVVERPRLLEEVHAWLAELVRESGHGCLRAFQAQAGGFESLCPGISSVLAQG